MSATNEFPAVSAYSEAGVASLAGPTRRIASVDIFRGFTILVMIFVNELAGVRGLPWWTYHMPAEIDAMTYVDMVFPVFLFIVGMSIPLSVRHRLSKGDSEARLWMHVIARTIALVVLGAALANSDLVNPQRTGMSRSLWTILILVGAVMFWNDYPRNSRHSTLFRTIKISGLLLMAAMFAIFRRVTPDGRTAWLDISYWGMLGLIGWTYLAVCILYIPTRRWRWAPVVWFLALALLNIFSVAHWIQFSDNLPFYLWPFNTGAFAMMSMAGLILSSIFLMDRFELDRKQKVALALALAAVFFVAGWLLTPLGISKIRATPTWCLYCAGTSVLIFLFLHWLCDEKQQTRWAAVIKPAGRNTLVTYLLPDIFGALLGGTLLLRWGRYGWPGVVKALLFTGAMLGISAILTRWKVRMQL